VGFCTQNIPKKAATPKEIKRQMKKNFFIALVFLMIQRYNRFLMKTEKIN